MSKIVIHPRSTRSRVLYPRAVAAQLARASLELLKWCEREELLRAQVMVGGERGYGAEDIRRLARIRSLREDLGLERDAVLIVLRMREQMIDLLQELNDLEELLMRREEELIREIQRLRRRVSEEARW